MIGQFKYDQRLDNTSHIFEGTYAMYGYNWYVSRRLKNSLVATPSSTTSLGNISSSSSTSIKSAKGNKDFKTITLSGRTYNLYKQGKGPWAGEKYNSLSNIPGKNTYGNTGCGPSAVAIALSGYNSSINPMTVGSLCLKNNPPSSMKSLSQSAIRLGFKSIVHPYNSNYTAVYNEIKNSLLRGRQIVMYVGIPAKESDYKPFTKSGAHFISILGIDRKNDKVFVGNSGRCDSGWFNLSSVVKARGNSNKGAKMPGWAEIYK